MGVKDHHYSSCNISLRQIDDRYKYLEAGRLPPQIVQTSGGFILRNWRLFELDRKRRQLWLKNLENQCWKMENLELPGSG
ncbi:hypothetical protein KPH14_002442 [Odynerus spinipes]|uniref:Uncharacterized protein n=1 Tax=Odynerus spinipes TaxID=1348599 RepID=A0AAD9VLG3_9HYME|nr:hypothetical protein KPH14_002442 [Odynerus spinipes]